MPYKSKHRRPHNSEILRQSFLAACLTTGITEFTQISALLIDGIVVTRYLGSDDIAATGLVSPLFYFIGTLAMLSASGLQTICSWELGRGKTDRVNDLLNQTLAVAAAVSLLFFALVYVSASPLAAFFGARGKAAHLLPLTRLYLRGLSFEFVPFILMSILTPLILLDDGGRIVMISSVVGAVADIAFDFIAAVNGFGVFGIGMATSLSVLVSFLCLLLHFRKKNSMIRLKPVPVRIKDILEVQRLGLPKAMHELAGMLRPMVLNTLIVSVGGSMAMAVMSIRSSISDFVEIPVAAIAGAVGLLAGVGYGERNGEDLEEIDILSRRILIAASAVIVSFLVLFARPVAVFYLGADSEALDLLAFAIRTVAIGFLFTGLVQARIRYLQATEHIRQAQAVEAAAGLVILLLCAFALSRLFGIRGIYAAFPLSQILTLGGLYLIQARKSKKLLPPHRDYLDLDERFYPDAGDIIEYPVINAEECVISSRQVRLFCVGHGLDRAKTYYSALCLEEITTNIVSHGFRPKGRHNAAEIRVIMSDGDLIIRVRDNGKEFNLKRIVDILTDEEDPFNNIGIKMIAASAKKIDYYRSWGSNITILLI